MVVKLVSTGLVDISQEYLNELTYKKFLEFFDVYPSRDLAACDGFEAHHINPICEQGKDRLDNEIDDRCIRCTPFEHVLAHYILAKELNSDDLLYSFFCMTYTNKSRLTDLEQVTIESLKEFGKLREESLKRRSDQQKKVWSDPLLKKNMSLLKKKQYIDNPSIVNNISKKFLIYDVTNKEFFIIKNLRKWKIENDELLSKNSFYQKNVDGLSNDEIDKIKLFILDRVEKINSHNLCGYIFKITTPNKEILEVDNLKQFCIKNKLSGRVYHNLQNEISCKGYTSEKLKAKNDTTYKILKVKRVKI